MQTTTNYGFNIVEGTDIVNPLTQLNPNFTALDSDLKAVSDNTVDNATCIKTGTVHAVTRVNTDANVFRFTATGNWNTGDTMTVDGTIVSVYVSDGTAPANNCFVINTEVMAAIQGTRVTLYVNSGDASNIYFDDTSVSYTANNVQTAIEAASTASGTEWSAGVSTVDAVNSRCFFNVGDTFSSSWIELTGGINASSTEMTIYMTLPKPIASTVNGVSISGAAYRLRVDGSNYDTGLSLTGSGINTRDGIVNFTASLSGINKPFHTGTLTISNLVLTFS